MASVQAPDQLGHSSLTPIQYVSISCVESPNTNTVQFHKCWIDGKNHFTSWLSFFSSFSPMWDAANFIHKYHQFFITKLLSRQSVPNCSHAWNYSITDIWVSSRLCQTLFSSSETISPVCHSLSEWPSSAEATLFQFGVNGNSADCILSHHSVHNNSAK